MSFGHAIASLMPSVSAPFFFFLLLSFHTSKQLQRSNSVSAINSISLPPFKASQLFCGKLVFIDTLLLL